MSVTTRRTPWSSRGRRPDATVRSRLLVERLEDRLVLDISINFVGGRPNAMPPVVIPPMAATEVAGVVPRPNWNNAPGNAGLYLPLVDHTGASLPNCYLLYGSNNTWTTGIPEQPGDNRLMGGYLDTTANDTTFVIVTGVSTAFAGAYDVIVYFSGDTHNGRYGFYTVLYSETKIGIDVQDFTGTYIEDTGGTGGNYVRFRNIPILYDLVLVATAQYPFDPAVSGFRAPINGIQIVPSGTGPTPGDGDMVVGDQVLVSGLTPGAPWLVTPNLSVPPVSRAGAPAQVDAIFAPAAQEDQGLVAPAPTVWDRAGDWWAQAVGTEVEVEI